MGRAVSSKSPGLFNASLCWPSYIVPIPRRQSEAPAPVPEDDRAVSHLDRSPALEIAKSRWPDEKGYVPPGLSKPPSQIAARRTGSDNE
jgi:hypothetical protein